MAAAAGRFSSVAMVLPELQSFDRFGKPIISTGERSGAGKPPSRKRRESRDGEGAALPPTGPPPLRRHLACARPGSRVPCAARPIPKGRKTNGRFVQGAGRRWRYARIKSALPWGRGLLCTLFYLDPPYWGTEHYYGRGLFGRDEFQELSAALQGLQGRFILSLNDVPEVRALFAWAQIETVELSYQAGGVRSSKRVREVVISTG